jgi:hypothetical protein
MDEKSLRLWVSDQLYGLLGYAEANLEAYIITLGACSNLKVSIFLFLMPVGRLSSYMLG